MKNWNTSKQIWMLVLTSVTHNIVLMALNFTCKHKNKFCFKTVWLEQLQNGVPNEPLHKFAQPAVCSIRHCTPFRKKHLITSFKIANKGCRWFLQAKLFLLTALPSDILTEAKPYLKAGIMLLWHWSMLMLCVAAPLCKTEMAQNILRTVLDQAILIKLLSRNCHHYAYCAVIHNMVNGAFHWGCKPYISFHTRRFLFVYYSKYSCRQVRTEKMRRAVMSITSSLQCFSFLTKETRGTFGKILRWKCLKVSNVVTFGKWFARLLFRFYRSSFQVKLSISTRNTLLRVTKCML